MIAGLHDLRTRLLILVVMLLLLDAAAITVLLSPIGKDNEARQRHYRQLLLEKAANSQAAAATQGMERKIEIAGEQEKNFDRERFIRRYSEMSETLARIARESGVQVSDIKYAASKQDRAKQKTPAGYQALEILMQVHGSYAQDMRFINAVEREKTLLIIDDVSFAAMTGDELTVSVRLTTYLRSAA
jgi:predicted glycoside hydrolase/deacetylase ChbG (UPF0249 family)